MTKPYSLHRFIANCFKCRKLKDKGEGGVGDMHLLRDGQTDGSKADDDEYINTLCLLRGADDDVDCDVFDDGDEEWDLLRDGLKYGDDGAYDEDLDGDDGGVGDMHLLRDGQTDGSKADDDEYINTLCLLRGADDDVDCDVFDDGDEERDLLRDGLKYGDDGADDEDVDGDDGE
nr:hypothetical protein [Tanacetum cinerariifolium]